MDGLAALVPGLKIGLLVAACATAVTLDVRYRRLPNWLTLGALLVALALRLPAEGWSAVGVGLGSATVAFAFGIPFFLMGGLGGGDVKLMAGLAAFLEPRALVPALLVMAFTGGLMAIVVAARRGSLGRVLANVYTILLCFVTSGRQAFSAWRTEEATGEETQSLGPSAPQAAVSNPYGVAIATGALAGWFL